MDFDWFVSGVLVLVLLGAVACNNDALDQDGHNHLFGAAGPPAATTEGFAADFTADLGAEAIGEADEWTPPSCDPGEITGNFQDGSYGMVWVEIPAGCFMMGCSLGDEACEEDENPQHRVTLPAFELLETEVTQDQYQAVIGSNPSQNTENGSFPVESVFWSEAAAFCTAVGGRLPTEAEWEYAARAGAATRFPCGDGAGCLPNVAWYAGNVMAIQPVKTRNVSAWGLYDMNGNVWEWTADHYDPDYYEGSPEDDPQGPVSGEYRVFRGGAYNTQDVELRVSRRQFPTPDGAFADTGVRCARDQ